MRVQNWLWGSQRGAAYIHLPCCLSSRILAFLLFSNTQNYGQEVCGWSLFKKAAMMVLFRKNSQQLKSVNYFCKKAPLLIKNLKKLYGPFLCARFKCLNATEPLWKGSLRFTTKSPEVPGTHSFDRTRNNERLSPPCSPFHDVNQ